jgi:hypothetical protein
MNPDIKNFSDITAIDTRDKLCVSTHLVADQKYKFWINDLQIAEKNTTTTWDLFSPLHFKIKNLSLTGTVVMEKITINGLEIMPRFCHLANNHRHFISVPGLWSFIIPDPFYIWYHDVVGHGMVA